MAREPEYEELFVQEVRRFFPFFPAVMARVRHDFEWDGYYFPTGRKVMLDLHATNHDARIWNAPQEFILNGFWGRTEAPSISLPKVAATLVVTTAAQASRSRLSS